jgi:hypothetical protein
LWSSSEGAILARLRVARFGWFVLLVPMLFHFSASTAGSINIGLRHILPVYPFPFALLGGWFVPIAVEIAGPAADDRKHQRQRDQDGLQKDDAQ